jgi:hypothetical protein
MTKSFDDELYFFVGEQSKKRSRERGQSYYILYIIIKENAHPRYKLQL